MRPKQTSTALRALLPTKQPLYLWGPPGVGKSSLVRQAAAVADAAERFWREHAEEDTAEALRAVGLLRGDDEADGIRAYGQGVTEKRLAEEGETD